MIAVLATACLGEGAPVEEAWVVRYDGPARGLDRSTAIAVDSAGSVYVTGRSPGVGSGLADYATVKYDAAGGLLWVARYDGEGLGLEDQACTVRIGPQGEVYVSGWSGGGASEFDIATMRYDPADGGAVWVRRFDAGGRDFATAMTVDPAGNVVVTGDSERAASGQDCVTIQYDRDGRRLWMAHYDGARARDGGRAVAVDSTGNVLVTGFSTQPARANDILTLKYDPQGHLMWNALYDGEASGSDEGVAVAADAAGDVCVTGWSVGAGTGPTDYLTLKYASSSGARLWEARYDGSARSAEQEGDRPQALALDSSGNVYVTGWTSSTGSGFDYTTIKYSPFGVRLWVRDHGGAGNDYASALAVTAVGEVVVTGAMETEDGGRAFSTVAYDASGNQLWTRPLMRFGGFEQTPTLALSPLGAVVVSGEKGADYVTVKYERLAAPQPFVRGDATADGSHDSSDAIAVLAFLFLGAAEPPCAASADSNDDGRIELADALLLLSFLFLGGRAPATPFPACGTEPTPDSLRCDEFPACTGA